MAFSASEVQVLRRALTVALREGRDSVDFWLLGRAIGEAQDERERLRAFMAAELRRYRAALPGTASSFLSCLRSAVDEVAHVPSAEDLAALRIIVDLPCGERERASRAALLRRCTRLAEAALEQRLAARARRRAAAEAARIGAPDPLDILIPGRSKPPLARRPLALEPSSRREPLALEPVPVMAAGPQTTPESHPAIEPRPEPHPEPEPHSEPEPVIEPIAEPCLPVGADPIATDPVAVADVEPPTAPDPPAETTPDRTESPESDAEPLDAGPTEPEPEPEPAEAEVVAPDHPHSSDPSTSPTSEPRTETATEECVEHPEPDPEILSPVIPHRRQGRILGQLPAPEILQTGTG